MSNICKSLKELSARGHWDVVFGCLHIDSNSTIELGNLKIPEHHNDLWLDDHKATLNSLEIIFGFILLCDQIFFLLLLLYLSLFIAKFVRLYIFLNLPKWFIKAKLALRKYQSQKDKHIRK